MSETSKVQARLIEQAKDHYEKMDYYVKLKSGIIVCSSALSDEAQKALTVIHTDLQVKIDEEMKTLQEIVNTYNLNKFLAEHKIGGESA